MERTFPFSFTSVEKPLTLYATYFYTVHSASLIYLPVLTPTPLCLDYCSFIVSIEIRLFRTSNFVFFKPEYLFITPQLWRSLGSYQRPCPGPDPNPEPSCLTDKVRGWVLSVESQQERRNDWEMLFHPSPGETRIFPFLKVYFGYSRSFPVSH